MTSYTKGSSNIGNLIVFDNSISNLEQFIIFFRNELLGWMDNTSETTVFKSIVHGSFGLKIILSKLNLQNEVNPSDLDLVLSIKDTIFHNKPTEAKDYVVNKCHKFINIQKNKHRYEIGVKNTNSDNSNVVQGWDVSRPYTLFYVIRIKYNNSVLVDISISDLNIEKKMIDIGLSKENNLPILRIIMKRFLNVFIVYTNQIL